MIIYIHTHIYIGNLKRPKWLLWFSTGSVRRGLSLLGQALAGDVLWAEVSGPQSFEVRLLSGAEREGAGTPKNREDVSSGSDDDGVRWIWHDLAKTNLWQCERENDDGDDDDDEPWYSGVCEFWSNPAGKMAQAQMRSRWFMGKSN